MFNSKAYAAASATSPLAGTTIARRDPAEHDVQIEILFCGICHSDLHSVRDEWSEFMPTVYPIVPGHEIVGRVTTTGSAVTKYKTGDLVAVGCLVFIPYLSLLNKERLPWATAGCADRLFASTVSRSVPMVGYGITRYSGFEYALPPFFVDAWNWDRAGSLPRRYKQKQNKKITLLVSCHFFAFCSSQSACARKKELTRLLVVIASLIFVIGAFAYNSNSDSFHERFARAERDLELAKQGNYHTSLGYYLLFGILASMVSRSGRFLGMAQEWRPAISTKRLRLIRMGSTTRAKAP
jgi:hypothetical protein